MRRKIKNKRIYGNYKIKRSSFSVAMSKKTNQYKVEKYKFHSLTMVPTDSSYKKQTLGYQLTSLYGCLYEIICAVTANGLWWL